MNFLIKIPLKKHHESLFRRLVFLKQKETDVHYLYVYKLRAHSSIYEGLFCVDYRNETEENNRPIIDGKQISINLGSTLNITTTVLLLICCPLFFCTVTKYGEKGKLMGWKGTEKREDEGLSYARSNNKTQ